MSTSAHMTLPTLIAFFLLHSAQPLGAPVEDGQKASPEAPGQEAAQKSPAPKEADLRDLAQRLARRLEALSKGDSAGLQPIKDTLRDLDRMLAVEESPASARGVGPANMLEVALAPPPALAGGVRIYEAAGRQN